MVVLTALPFILVRPWIGILVWTWLGFMNPHRLGWGFAQEMPFAFVVAITTFIGMAMSREPKRIPWTRETVVLVIFIGWMVITTVFAAYPALAQQQLLKVVKIQLMIFVALMLINDKERLNWLVLTIAMSIGFYGLKGGIFTILQGGIYRVQGPPGTFIGGNNEVGLALAMTIPLLYYCARYASQRWLRLTLLGTMLFSALAAIGTQSRGALLAMAVMGTMFWFKSKQKVTIALCAIVAIGAIVLVMPEQWYDRMNTIRNYDTDKSALGRINSWQFAWNVAKDRPFGGGFETFRPRMFRQYAPNPTDSHDAHSIYFEVLGEHGFVGLGLFLLLGMFTWFSAGRIRRAASRLSELRWLGDLAAMVQVSLVAYATAGIFLGMAYFDYYYNLVLIIVVGRVLVDRHLKTLAEGQGNRIGVPRSQASAGASTSPSSATP
jgi:probable O-glycosylation ligase (exosortase A-associated)